MKKHLRILGVAVLATCATQVSAQFNLKKLKDKVQNAAEKVVDKTIDKKVDSVLKLMTLDDKSRRGHWWGRGQEEPGVPFLCLHMSGLFVIQLPAEIPAILRRRVGQGSARGHARRRAA